VQATLTENMPAAHYHADPCPTPSLSASVASELIRRSPLHAWLKHPRLGNARRESTPEMTRGTLIHATVLGKGAEGIRFLSFDNYRTKAAQEARDEALQLGFTPVLEKEADDAIKVASDIRDALKAAGLVLDGISEAVAQWTEDTPAGPVACRGMLDHVKPHAGQVIDLKTCRSAHPKAIKAHIRDYGYGVQASAYTSAMEKVYPDLAGRIDYVWVFIEELPPGARSRVTITVARPDGAMRELGRRQWGRACETWARCLRDDCWPAYTTGGVMVSPDQWEIDEETP